MDKIYVVTMSDFEDGNIKYIQGVFSTKGRAEKSAIAEEFARGGDYVADIHEMELDEPVSQKYLNVLLHK
jgi:hypothetical protein